MKKKYFALLLFFVGMIGFGQNPLPIDFTYRHADERPIIEGGISMKFTVQPDGKIIVSGIWNLYYASYGVHRPLIRLNPDQTLDSSFAPNFGSQSSVQHVELQSDGKILVGGEDLQKPDGTLTRIVRLNPDGTFDPSFQDSATISLFEWFKVTSNDKIIYINSGGGISRLNADGTPDTTFTTYPGAEGPFVLQPDGKILVPSGNNLVRLNADGTIDPSFQVSTYACGIDQVKVAYDGKILICGRIESGVQRLNPDGTPDSSFAADSGIVQCGQSISSICPLPNGKVLIGDFLEYGPAQLKGILRLNQDGSLDASFPARLNSRSGRIELTPNGNAIVWVNDIAYPEYDGLPVQNPIMIDGEGNLLDNGLMDSMDVRKILIGQQGDIIQIGDGRGAPYQMGIRVTDANGNLVATPNTMKGFKGLFLANQYRTCDAAVMQADGKIIVTGRFSEYGGVSRNGIARLNTDYSLDTTFDPGTGFLFSDALPYGFSDVALQSDGKIIVYCPWASHYNGVPIQGEGKVIRLFPNGQLDTSFNTPDIAGLPLLIRPDDKIYLGVYARLNPNGDIDNSYSLDPYAATYSVDNTSFLLPDGKIQFGSQFRLNEDGSIDPSYTEVITDGFIRTIVRQPDGKFIMAGEFEAIFLPGQGDLPIANMIRVHPNGTLDASFDAGSGFDGLVSALHLSPNGGLLAGGYFRRYNGEWCNGSIRLLGEGSSVLIGKARYDTDGNGCSANDPAFPNLKLRIESAGLSMDYICDDNGDFAIPLGTGAFTVTPVFENQGIFTANPSSFAVDFSSGVSSATQDICITATGLHPDLEVSVVPTSPARPGFLAEYSIICKNKGTQIENAQLTFNFPGDVAQYDFMEPSPDSADETSAQWNLTGFNIQETRYFTVRLLLNTPTDTPPLTGNEILDLSATLTSASTDENPQDNTFHLSQTVVNSFDPNDKTCAEGTSVGIEQIGEYVHYVIRFENTGTYSAQNIRVRDIIDTSKYDISTLIPLGGSSHFTTTIAEGNVVDFYFENINLPFEDSQNDGFVAFKIKLLNNLEAGDVFSNAASIYFDYNEAIQTNAATTTIEQLSTGEVSMNGVKVFPNPAKDSFEVSCENAVLKSVSVYDVYGRLVRSEAGIANSGLISVSDLASGTYFVKIFTDKGNSVQKIIKQ